MDDAERHSSAARSRRYRRRLRWAATGLLLLAFAYAAVSMALHVLLDADYLEGKINSALAVSTDSLYTADLEHVRWSLWGRALQADHLALHPDPDALQQLRADARLPTTVYNATLHSIRLQGIDLWTLFWHRDLNLNSVAIQRPHVRIDVTGSERSTTSGKRQAASSDQSANSVHASLARQLSRVEIHQLMLREGTLSRKHMEGSAPSDTLWGISLEVDELAIDSVSAQDKSKLLFSKNIEVGLKGYRRVSADSLYAFTMGPVRASSQDAALSVEAIRLAPTVSDHVFMRRKGHRVNRFITSASRLSLSEVNFRRFVEERALLATMVEADSLTIKVYRNNHLPRPPEDPPPKMPHELFQVLESPIRLDTIRVRNGYISYTKLAENAAEPGTITFEEVSASTTNVTNDSSRMTPTTPAVVSATTRVAGAGQLQATIQMPLLSPHLVFSYQGRLDAMDARAFNAAFVNFSGVRIESGRVDSLWFEANVEHGVADGALEGVYRNLEVETLDKKSGDRGLKKQIQTLILNGLVLKSSNTPEEGELRTGVIDHEHNEEDPFFKFLWHSVRSGLFSLLGL